MTDTIAELRSLLAKATPGPWQAVSRQIPWSLENGKTGSHTEWRIGTIWDHPQSRAPAPVVTGSVGLGLDGGPPVHLVHISEEDAAIIVAMRNSLPALLDRVEAGERGIDFLDMRRPIKGIEYRSAEEVFAIMADRIRLAEAGHYRLPPAPQQKADTP